MAVNPDLVAKGFKRLLILLALLIISPLLLTISFKALKIYSEGTSYYISILGIVISGMLILYTLYFAFRTFQTLLDALFSDKS